MANCNELFRLYNSAIRLSDDKREVLRRIRNTLRDKMGKGFTEIPKAEIGEHTLRFQSQGSYVMDTIIMPWDDDFDLDDGVYFIGNLLAENRPSTENFHKWVLQAVGKNEDYADVIDKDTCVRVQYEKEKFHIDLPIYYSYDPKIPDLAHKKNGWIASGPIEFIYWFESKVKSGFEKSFLLENAMKPAYRKWATDIRKADAQLRRIVRYLKGWGDNLRGDMPPGIIMTILAAENYVANERDDISLKDTLVNIKRFLEQNGCKCPRPTTPAGEDLFAAYSQTQKKYFLDRLDTFVSSASQAIASVNQMEACLKWQKHLGNRFSCAIAKDEIEGAKQYVAPAIIGDSAKSA
jgi:hypothetical protein